MNIVLNELQVTEDRSITKRMSGLLGGTITALETYTLKAEPLSDGTYSPISINPVSFKYLSGIAIKSDGISKYEAGDHNVVTGKTIVVDKPIIDESVMGIDITPKYSIVDSAVIESAAQILEDGTPTNAWEIVLKDKNYMYSSIVGTPVTGKLEMRNRELILAADGRIAKIIIENILKDGDDVITMTSDEYHTRVAEEIQTKLDYFFGSTYCNVVYDIATSSYKFRLMSAGEKPMSITSTSREDLSYFGMVSPTIKLGTAELSHPHIKFMDGILAEEAEMPAVVGYPNTVVATLPPGTIEAHIVNATILLAQMSTINYEIMLYQ